MSAGPYVAAVKRLNLALIVLAGVCASFGYQSYRLNKQIETSQRLQFLIAVRDASTAMIPFKRSDLPRVSLQALIAQREYLLNKAVAAADGRSTKFVTPFDDTLVENAELLPRIVWPLSPRVECSAVSFTGRPDKQAYVFDANNLNNPFIGLNRISLLNFAADCGAYQFGMSSLLLVRDDNGNLVQFGVPKPTLAYLADTEHDLIARFSMAFPTEVSPSDMLAPGDPTLKQYINTEPTYAMVSVNRVEVEVFREAANISGRFRLPNDIDGAMSDLSEVKTAGLASFEGISLAPAVFVKFAPLVTVALLFMISRHLKLLNQRGASTEGPWLIKDAMTAVELAAGCISAVVPLIAALVIFGVFSLDNHLILKVGPISVDWLTWIGASFSLSTSSPALQWYGVALLGVFCYSIYLGSVAASHSLAILFRAPWLR